MNRLTLLVLAGLLLIVLDRIRITVNPPGASFPALAALLIITAAATVAFAAVVAVRFAGRWTA